jgi:hypothetical protein
MLAQCTDDGNGHDGIIIRAMDALPDRPLIALTEIAAHLHVTVTRLRGLCADRSPLPIPVTPHPTHGELLSLNSTRMLIERALASKSHGRKDRPHAHDRISLLLWLTGLHGRPRKSYDQSVEDEVHRISRLSEPARVLRALDMLARYVDAKSVAEALYRLKRLPKTKLPAKAVSAEQRLRELIHH